MSFNPNSAVVTGLEWRPTVGTARASDTNGLALLGILDSATTEDISRIFCYVPAFASPGLWAVEIFEDGNELLDPIDDVDADEYLPSIDLLNDTVTAGGLWSREPGGTTATGTLFQAINDDPPSDADVMRADGATDFGARYAFGVASGGFAGERVLGMTLDMTLGTYGDTVAVYFTDTVAAQFLGRFGGATGFGVKTVQSVLGDVHPLDRTFWTPARVQDMAATDGFMFVKDTAPVMNLVDAKLTVRSCPENREAWGVSYVELATAGWVEFEMVHPDGAGDVADNWEKAAGIRYIIALRRLIDPVTGPVGGISWGLLARDACPHVGWVTGTWRVDPLTGLILEDTRAEFDDEAFGVMLQRDAGSPSYSTESQPYGALQGAPVDNATSARQDFTAGATGSYSRLRATIQPAGTSVGSLTAKIKTQSGDVQQGSTVTITADEARLLLNRANGFRMWDVMLASAASLTNGTGYYVLFESTDEPEDQWAVAYLDAFSPFFAEPTFQGSTEAATISGSNEITADLEVTVAIAPDPVDNLQAVIVPYDIDPAGTDCDVASVDLPVLTWPTTSLGADFGYYQLERTQDDGDSWEVIRRVDSESTLTFTDKEMRRGLSVRYRIAVADDAGSLSDYVESTTLFVDAAGCALMFASNELEDTPLAFDFIGPLRSWRFLDADLQVHHLWYCRDGSGVYQPAESALEEFDVTLIVYFLQGFDPPTPATPGRDIFDPILPLMNTDARYIAVTDEVGERWFASVAVHEGFRLDPAGYYTCTVTVRELTRTPTIVTD